MNQVWVVCKFVKLKLGPLFKGIVELYESYQKYSTAGLILVTVRTTSSPLQTVSSLIKGISGDGFTVTSTVSVASHPCAKAAIT